MCFVFWDVKKKCLIFENIVGKEKKYIGVFYSGEENILFGWINVGNREGYLYFCLLIMF